MTPLPRHWLKPKAKPERGSAVTGMGAGDVALHHAGAGGRCLLVADHASNAVPEMLDLGVAPDIMNEHIAVDIGVAALVERMRALLGVPSWTARWSRLVCDTNRPPAIDMVAPPVSDGVGIPGNQGLSSAQAQLRLDMHAAFHDGLSQLTEAAQPRLLVSVHSFTPALKSAGQARPWPVAILWNRDDRGAALALAALAEEEGLGGPVGVNEPYSGQILNYTMDRHAEARGLPYVGFEVRQDGLLDAAGLDRWAGILSHVVARILERLP